MVERRTLKPEFGLREENKERRVVTPDFTPQGTEERERRVVKPEFDFPGKGWSPSGDSGTKILITDVAASEFDVANKWPKLDASGYLLLAQIIGNVPGLNASGLLTYTVQSKTTHYTCTNNEIVLVDATAAAVTITLPAAVTGAQIIVKKTDSSANVVTIATPSAETIDGVATTRLTVQHESITLVSDGTNWFII